MASKRQLEANRLNARHSTGPKSDLGKARTRPNAVKHGLTAKDVVIGDEDPQDFEALRTELLRDFEPGTRIEYELIDRLASLLWRIRRIPGLEAALAKIREQDSRSRSRPILRPRQGRLTDIASMKSPAADSKPPAATMRMSSTETQCPPVTLLG
jgi:hypothetical protein